MNSIRPLITIAILVGVGVVLYIKINEGAPQPAPEAPQAWNEPAEGVPPLAASSVAPTTSDAAAPPWPATTATPAAPAASAPAATVAPPAPTADAGKPPVVPAIPEMPEIAVTTEADAPAAAPVAPATAPAAAAEAPTAPAVSTTGSRYGDPAPATEVAPPVDAATNATPPGIAAGVAAPATAAALSAEAATTPEQMNEATAATSGIPSTPAPLEANPLRPSTQTTPLDRYGATAPTAPAATTPIESAAPAAAAGAAADSAQTFAGSWPAIQAALDRGDLAEGHKLLSRWHGDASLTPTDAERVETLLSQLAGTVVYSTEHRLEPARVVKPGETLETIAKEYNVPWQLLAKINGMTAADQVQAGRELKVLRGPFSAVVDLSRNQLTLSVDGRYAGKFPISVNPGQPINEGEWTVGDKSTPEAPARALLLQGNAGAPGTPAPQIVILSDAAPVNVQNGPIIKVAAKDVDELSDILSIGSRVVTRR